MLLIGLLLGLRVVVGSDPTVSTSFVTVTATTDVPTSLPFSLSLLAGSVYTSRSHVRTTSLPTVSVSQVATTVHLPQITTSPVPVFIPPHIDTHVTPAFAVGGALLILTGLPMALYGHKNRWSSLFLIGLYTASLMALILILRFGVLQDVKPPTPKLQGVFLLASFVAGFLGGASFIFFWRTCRYLIGAWGGFTFSLWIQSFHSNGAIRSVAGRWAFYITFAVVAFCLCTVPKLHLRVVLGSTAMVGSTAFVLGLDCLTTAGLKEFYLSNLGLGKLFPILGGHFRVGPMMTIEIVLLGGMALMGGAVQLRLLDVLQRRMAELRRDEEEEERVLDEKSGKVYKAAIQDREVWERGHGDGLASQDVERGIQRTTGSKYDLPFLPFTGAAQKDRDGEQHICESPIDDNPRTQDGFGAMDKTPQAVEHYSILRPTSSFLIPGSPETWDVLPTSSAPLDSLPARPPRSLPPDRRRVPLWDAPTMLGEPVDFDNPLKIQDGLDCAQWDNSAQDRVTLYPPAETPIPRPYSDTVVPASPAVAEALERRRMREATILSPQFPDIVRRSSEFSPIPSLMERQPAKTGRMSRKRLDSFSGLRQSFSDARQTFSGIRIIPDIPFKPHQRRQSEVPSPVKPVRNVTLGELDARHKEKIRALQGTVTTVERERIDDQATASWERRPTEGMEGRKGQRTSWNVGGNHRSNRKLQDLRREKSRTRVGSRGMDDVEDAILEPSSSQSLPENQPPPPQLISQIVDTQHEKRRSSRSLEAWNFFTSPGAPIKPAPN